MEIVDRIRRVATRAAQRVGIVPKEPDLGSFTLSADMVAKIRSAPPTEMHRAFFDVTKRPAHKWSHYLEIYDRYLHDRRRERMVLFEIGVFDGGSLEMWRNYLGPDAVIVGIDINPDCATRVDAPNIVRIGSQADQAFLKSLVSEYGPPDVVLDDGSHIAKHQRASFAALFPELKDGGLYLIEDTHTSYWSDWDGGYRRPGTAIEEAKALVDDLHAWYHRGGSPTGAHEQVGAIHFHDSVIVIEKATTGRPGMISSHGR